MPNNYNTTKLYLLDYLSTLYIRYSYELFFFLMTLTLYFKQELNQMKLIHKS